MLSFKPKSYSKRLLPIISWSHWFTFFNIIAAIILSIFYLVSEGTPETAIGKIYLVTNWLSHMGFLTFMAFVIFLFPIILVVPKTRLIRGIASVVFTGGLLLILLDAFIYSELGYHLNLSSTDQIIELIRYRISEDNRLFWFVGLLATLLILSFELVVSNYAWKHLRSLQRTQFSRFAIFGLVITFFVSHFIHIWADANLEYDVLRQDSMLPLSYPSTAKTLLTKYGMFDHDDYVERSFNPLALNIEATSYPVLPAQCMASAAPKNSTFLILSEDMLTSEQLNGFAKRTTETRVIMTRHVDNALPNDAWFNMLFGLPSIYKESLINQDSQSLLMQALEQKRTKNSLTIIGDQATPSNIASWVQKIFHSRTELSDISSLVFAKKLNRLPPGLQIVYFKENSQYQFELFVDALLLAQKQKRTKDNIWVSSLGNLDAQNTYASKPALMVLPNTESRTIDQLTSHMDLQHTLLKHWLDCKVPRRSYTNGKDLLHVKRNRVFANTHENGLMVFSRDKSVFIDSAGNFQSYSSQLEIPIATKKDLPLMIDGVNFIKQFSKQTQ